MPFDLRLRISHLFASLLAIAFTLSQGQISTAQVAPPALSASSSSSAMADNLPDAPEGHASQPESRPTAPKQLPPAPLYNKYIEAGQPAQPLLGFQRKLAFGADQVISPYFLLSVVSSAGYEHLVNSSPNYGTNSGAFGQRVGAAAIRTTSDSLFTDGLMPAIFHQDPRYYVLGKGHSVSARGFHAVLHVFVTHSDSGTAQPNYSLFAGHAATAILENAYYPDNNHGVAETASSFGGSLAGTALSNTVREFFPDLLHLIHRE